MAHRRMVRLQRLDHLLLDAQHRVERHHRVLEDHGDTRTAQLAHALFGETGEILALKKDAAAGDAPGRVDEADDREPRHRLAGAALADEAENLTARDAEADVVDRLDDP